MENKIKRENYIKIFNLFFQEENFQRLLIKIENFNSEDKKLALVEIAKKVYKDSPNNNDNKKNDLEKITIEIPENIKKWILNLNKNEKGVNFFL